MIITVEGRVRRGAKRGWGIFSSLRWDERRYRVKFDTASIASGELIRVPPDVKFRCELLDGKVFVRAEVKRKPFIICEADPEKAKVYAFSILTVKAIEVFGRVRCATPAEPDPE